MLLCQQILYSIISGGGLYYKHVMIINDLSSVIGK